MADHSKYLHCVSFGLTLGLLWGVCSMLTAWLAIIGWGATYVNTMGSVYVSYEASFWGGIMGFIWGFIDGFIGGSLFAWLYNKFAKHFRH